MRQALVYDYPLIDVIVRESIQNSLDALKDCSDHLEMSYRTGRFQSDEFESVLDGSPYNLSSRFGQSPEFLEIRDLGTYGLDGPCEVSDELDGGRWTKLVYSFAEKQTESGKGGSWGYGKTCFFNLGVGFVVYYSRTMLDGEFVSRLAVALVEDTDHRRMSIIPESKQGITYWGSQSEHDPDQSVPLTNDVEIGKVLEVFDTKPFGCEETGTVIIIPFIDTGQLVKDSLEHMYSDVLPEDGRYDFKRLVFLSVQRWYFSRLLECEGQAPIYFRYNGELLSYDKMESVFIELRQLYTKTFDDSCELIRVKDNIEGTEPVAFLAYGTYSMDWLSFPYDMGLPEMFLCEEGAVNALGMKCRGTGMIVKYDLAQGITRGLKPNSDNECILAVLRINPQAKVTDEANRPIVPLDEYVRRGEPPAHDMWRDIDLNRIDPSTEHYTPRLVEKILRNANDRLSKKYKKKLERESGRRVGMSRAVGSLLFPEGFFKTGSVSRSSGGSERISSGRTRSSISRETGVDYTDGGMVVKGRFTLGRGREKLRLSIVPDIDGENVESVVQWEEKTGTSFPYSVESVTLTNMNGKLLEPPEPIGDLKIVNDIQFEPMRHGMNITLDEIFITKKEDPIDISISVSIRRTGFVTFPLKIVLREVDDDQ